MPPCAVKTPVCGRFAPTPSGRMHAGNVLAALMSWLSAKSAGGSWILRHEDLDTSRTKFEYAQQIEDDLRWLGLVWDDGGVAQNCFQSRRFNIYDEYFDVLRSKTCVYLCFCTRADLMAANAPHASDGRVVYSGKCRNLTADEVANLLQQRNPAWRVAVPNANIVFTDRLYGPQCVNLAQVCGDFIVRRADGVAAYQLAVVVDDALMGVTEVVRGSDLLLSAAQQIYLYNMLGFDVPQFGHVPLLCNANGVRLSKRDQSLGFDVMRATMSAQQIIGWLAFTVGLIPKNEPVSAQELISEFSWSKVVKSESIRL